jgi:hypothetical protein
MGASREEAQPQKSQQERQNLKLRVYKSASRRQAECKQNQPDITEFN